MSNDTPTGTINGSQVVNVVSTNTTGEVIVYTADGRQWTTSNRPAATGETTARIKR